MAAISFAKPVPAEGSGAGVAAFYLLFALVIFAVLLPLAWLIGRDANRRGRNGWLWGVLFVWQPVIVGLIYLVVRQRPTPRQLATPVHYPWETPPRDATP
jgi:hypothetical protein